MSTKIEWAEETWNPVVGCSIVSPGCTNCYAMRVAHRLGRNPRTPHYHGLTELVNGKPVWTGRLAAAPDKTWLAPLTRRKPTRYFVNSMGDLFHPDMREEWLDRIFAVMALCPRHRFLILTKRGPEMQRYCGHAAGRAENIYWTANRVIMKQSHYGQNSPWPMPNVWLGVSVERPQELHRLDDLRGTPAAIRWASFEPLLADLGDLSAWLPMLDWAVIGGESGSGARVYDLAGPRNIIGQCRAAGVAVYHKQVGARPFDSQIVLRAAGASPIVGSELMCDDRKGGEPSEWPADLRVREYPVP